MTAPTDQQPHPDDDARPPSKSQRKRDMHALQALGVQLVAESPARLDRLPLPENLRDAIDAAAKMKRSEAQRRQLQLIGRLMRNVDVDPIREALALLDAEERARARASTRAAAARARGEGGEPA